jgi:hypothetical protein
MLTLDQSTLFYWTLSDKKQKHGRAINDWASAIPSNAKPVSCAASQVAHPPSQMARKPSSSCSILPLPSLTSGTSGSTAPSVLTNNVRIVSHVAPAPAKVKPKPIDIRVNSNAGLSDNNETNGNERKAAVNSPPKGRKCITSDVCFVLLIIIAT